MTEPGSTTARYRRHIRRRPRWRGSQPSATEGTPPCAGAYDRAMADAAIDTRSEPSPVVDDGREHDVLVIGGGPSGSACAYWLADAGWDVVLVERKHFPREKTCGDGLTPRSLRQLSDMGIDLSLAGAHRYDGLRSCAYGLELELPWPAHPSFPSHGFVITRHDLDVMVAERAEKAGATLWQEMEAIEALDEMTPAAAGKPGSEAALPNCT